jgi:alkylhydroperoxidase/carboxymuconolactone decarboxylase family protein YurZ
MTSSHDRTGQASQGEQSGAAKMFGDFRARPGGLHRRRLTYHLGLARRNGVTETELIEAITHLAFYAGWPGAMSAMTAARQAFMDS